MTSCLHLGDSALRGQTPGGRPPGLLDTVRVNPGARVAEAGSVQPSPRPLLSGGLCCDRAGCRRLRSASAPRVSKLFNFLLGFYVCIFLYSPTTFLLLKRLTGKIESGAAAPGAGFRGTGACLCTPNGLSCRPCRRLRPGPATVSSAPGALQWRQRWEA